MSTPTATPAEGTQAPAATSQPSGTAPAAAPAADPKSASGASGTTGASGEPKAPAASPAAPKQAAPEGDGTLLGKKLPPADPAKGAAEASKEGAQPKAEQYEVTLPDGSLLSAETAKAMSQTYRDLGLTKEQGQKMAEHANGLLKGYVDDAVRKVQELDNQNWDNLQKHPKYGGQNLGESNKMATAALDKFFPGLKAKLINSPYAADPDLFGGLVELGRMITDPKFRLNGLPPEPKPTITPAQSLYGVDGRGLNAQPKEGTAA